MLPDFPLLKQDIVTLILVPAFDRARLEDPLLGNIKSTIQHEGDRSSYQTVEGKIKDQPYQQFHEDMAILPEDVVDKDLEYMIEKFSEMGLNAATQLAQYSFSFINSVIDETGNSIDAKGRPVTPDLILEALEKIPIDFDEKTGLARFPTFYINPSQKEVFQKAIADATADKNFKVRFDKMVERKKEEWRDRENNRKLVD